MNIKLAVAVLGTVCAGCGGNPQNADDNEHAVAQTSSYATGASSAPHDPLIDAVLIENACNAISECRTTANALGV